MRLKVRILYYWLTLDSWLNDRVLKLYRVLKIEPPDWALDKFFDTKDIRLKRILERWEAAK